MIKFFRNKLAESLSFFIVDLLFLVCIIVIIYKSLPLDILEIICCTFFCIIAIFAFLAVLYLFQRVDINDKGIKFYNLLGCRYFIKWEDIEKITIINKDTYSNSMGFHIHCNWIKIHKKDNSLHKKFKNEIIYTKKKLDVLIDAIKKYNSEISLDEIPTEISDKEKITWLK